jgi:hypothetical protein
MTFLLVTSLGSEARRFGSSFTLIPLFTAFLGWLPATVEIQATRWAVDS